MEYLSQHIESLIFTAIDPITYKEIKTSLETSFDTKFKEDDISNALEGIKEKYQESDFAFEIVEIADGFQFLTKGSYHNTVGTYLKQTTKKRLSKAALETLSIIAYKQPVTRAEMEKIRGVSCDYSVQKLLEKELISMVGRSDGPGRALLYGTSEKFMDYFGLKGLSDLPKLKDFKQADSEVGELAPIDEEYTPNGIDQKNKTSLTAFELVADNISAIIGILYNEEDLPIEEEQEVAEMKGEEQEAAEVKGEEQEVAEVKGEEQEVVEVKGEEQEVEEVEQEVVEAAGVEEELQEIVETEIQDGESTEEVITASIPIGIVEDDDEDAVENIKVYSEE